MNFAGTPLPQMSSIMSDQGNLPYYDYIYNGPKPLTESGWELLLVNVGRYPDDIREITGSNDFRSFPYIVIYNKYLGKIRVFCKFGLDQTVHEATNAIEIYLSFESVNKYSGAMRLYDGKNQSLEEEKLINTLFRFNQILPLLGRYFNFQWLLKVLKLFYSI